MQNSHHFNLFKIISITFVALALIIGGFYFLSNSGNSVNLPVALNPNLAQEVRIAYQANSNSVPLFTALEKGYFTKNNITPKLVEFTSSNTAIEGMTRGDIDIIAFSALFNPINANITTKSNDIKVFSVATDKNSPKWFGILASPNSSIKSLKDLENKNLGSLPGPTQIVVKNYLKQNNVDIDKINFSTPDGALQGGLLIENKLDALATFEPNITDLTTKSAKLISTIDTKVSGTDYSLSGGFISSSFIAKNPELAKSVIKVLDNGIKDSQNPTVEIKNYQLKYVKTNPEVVAKAQLPEYLANDEVNTTELQKLLDYYASVGLIKQKVNASELVYKP